MYTKKFFCFLGSLLVFVLSCGVCVNSVSLFFHLYLLIFPSLPPQKYVLSFPLLFKLQVLHSIRQHP